MNKKEAIAEIDGAIECLYQNREKIAMHRVANLLPFFHDIAQNLLEKEDYRALYAMEMTKKLIENYNHFDMLGMADCLRNDGYDLLEMYDIVDKC